ncbi:MAG: SsrA-binding protein SmpB [Patescibacteria group bacterium]
MPTLATNKKAYHDFEILEEFEGGLRLSGPEVKSVRAGNVSLTGSFLTIQKGELYLKNAHIGHFAPAGKDQPEDTRHERKVLVHKRELGKLRAKHEADRLTIVPISLYTSRGFVKLGFALAKGKKKHEKRETLKKRDLDREIRARLKE